MVERIFEKLNLSKKTLLYILLLSIVSMLLFSYTLNIRRPWFGHLSYGHHQWATCQFIVYVKNWLRDGALNIKLGLFDNPSSVEFSNLSSRALYPSYPPGFLIPIYILKKYLIKDKELPTIIMSYNTLNQYLIACILSIITFLFLYEYLRVGYFASLIFSFIPIILELLSPGPLYFHQNIFFSDEVIILPFVLFLLLELLRDIFLDIKKVKLVKPINLIQGLIFFWGSTTDWLMFFVGIVFYLKRIYNAQVGNNIRDFIWNTLYFWVPFVACASLYLGQIFYFNAFNAIKHKYVTRTGLDRGLDWYFSSYKEYLFGNLKAVYGELMVKILLAILFCLIIWIIHRLIFGGGDESEKLVSYMVLALFPCFMQTAFFRWHSIVHDFSALKFIVPISLVVFVFFPIFAFSFLKSIVEKFISIDFNLSYRLKNAQAIVPMFYPSLAFFMLFLSMWYISIEHPKYKSFFPENSDFSVEHFISNNVAYNDVVFSPHYDIVDVPPHRLSFTMKRVYRFNQPIEILDFIKNRGVEMKDYVINIVILKHEHINNLIFERIEKFANSKVESSNAFLFKFNKQAFNEFANCSIGT